MCGTREERECEEKGRRQGETAVSTRIEKEVGESGDWIDCLDAGREGETERKGAREGRFHGWWDELASAVQRNASATTFKVVATMCG